MTQIVLRRLQVAPIGFGFGTSGVHRGHSLTDVFVSGFLEQLPDDPLRLFVAAFAELVMPDAPPRRSAAVSGGELSHPVAPARACRLPLPSASVPMAAPIAAVKIAANPSQVT